MADWRRLAGLHLAIACVVAALAGLPGPPRSAGPSLEPARPASAPDWGSRSAPSDRLIDRARPGSTSLKSGFESAAAAGHNASRALPAGATLLARSASETAFTGRIAGAHSGRSPPRNS